MTKKRKNKQTKKKKNNSVYNQNKLRDHILELFNTSPGKAYSVRQITKRLNIRGKNAKNNVLGLLFQMTDDGEIARIRNNFKSNREPKTHEGRVDFISPKLAFLISDDFENDPKVKVEDLKFALDGDIVAFNVTGRSDQSPRAKVIRIIERKRNTFVGRIDISPKYAFVIADNKRMHYDIFVKNSDINKAAHNDKVIVEITQWPDWDKNPEGKIIKILGKAGENDAEIHSIMAEFDLPFEFDQEIEMEAKKIEGKISTGEIEKRSDFRKVTTFTIDPEDAKDFDDALSFREMSNGNFEVGVHIADVTHYVKSESMLDREAYERATSVYLVDRTIPMLPERLSNDLCSLRPNEDKLTFSAVFEMDKNANIIKEWFGRTVIHSDKRFSYEDAQQVIEAGEGDFAREIVALNTLAGKLRKVKFQEGAVNFETTEVKFKLDENGKPLGVIPKVRKDAHKMIEEFMLLANKRVAHFIYHLQNGKDKNTFVYRIHDNPDPEKLNTFTTFAKRFSHELDLGKKGVSKSLNGLMDNIEGKPEQNVLQSLAIRSMAKAIYTTAAKGHFGLAFDHYTHFTSPIRRYPDMMVHRLLQHYIDNGKSVGKDEYEEKCIHSSEMEKRAADAERASIKYKQVEFMQNAEDKAFEGIVSGVTEWGIYVEIIETKCEGMVKMSDLNDDFYEYDEKNFRAVGVRTKRTITLGDNVKVKVKSTDIDRRIIDLVFV